MKKWILFLFLAGTFSANSQSLKDLLYSGKLKKDSGTVIRKTDDLKSKIDTAEKKSVALEMKTAAKVPGDTTSRNSNANVDSTVEGDIVQDPATTPEVKVNAAPVKSNTKIFKEYSDSLAANLGQILSSKKVKKETYYFLAEYEIEADGKVSLLNLSVSPENDFLLGQVQQQMLGTLPQLAPVLDSSKTPRKTKRRFNFSVTKE